LGADGRPRPGYPPLAGRPGRGRSGRLTRLSCGRTRFTRRAVSVMLNMGTPASRPDADVERPSDLGSFL